MDNNMTGKGAVGLMVWRLARAGMSFEMTYGNSPEGDIWVRTAGKILRLEVKGSRSKHWNIGPDQLSRSDYVAFVCITDAATWVLSQKEVSQIVGKYVWRGARGDVYGLTPKMFPAASQNALGVLVGRPDAGRPRARINHGKPRELSGVPECAHKVVTKRLSGGEVRSYYYDRATRKALGFRLVSATVSAPMTTGVEEVD